MFNFALYAWCLGEVTRLYTNWRVHIQWNRNPSFLFSVSLTPSNFGSQTRLSISLFRIHSLHFVALYRVAFESFVYRHMRIAGIPRLPAFHFQVLSNLEDQSTLSRVVSNRSQVYGRPLFIWIIHTRTILTWSTYISCVNPPKMQSMDII